MESKKTDLATPVTTAIGSLPHHNIDAALAFAFRVGIPFLPQIPIRNPWEFMIAQALEGLPGLEVEKDGSTHLNADVWAGRAQAFDERLLDAFASSGKRDAFAAFEPSPAASSSWQPFLWELGERHCGIAKIQLAGPMTCQWVLRLKDGKPLATQPEIAVQIYRLLLARGIAMTRRLQAQGVRPLLFLDEPALYGFDRANPRHVMGMQELNIMVQALQKEGVLVGLHCCSNTDWAQVLDIGLDILSLDTELSLDPVLAEDGSREFIARGGRFALGVIPTARRNHGGEPEEILAGLLAVFARRWSDDTVLVQKVLRSALYTPACGLALHSPDDAESILAALLSFEGFLQESLA